MITDIIADVRTALKGSSTPLTLEEVAAKADLSIRMATRALDALQVLGEVRTDRRYAKGRRGALPQVFRLSDSPAQP